TRVARGAERIAGAVAGATVREPGDEVGAAVPLGRARAVGDEALRAEEQPSPGLQDDPSIVRKAQRMRAIRLPDRRQAAQEREDRVGVLVGDACVLWVRKRGIERSPVLRAAFAQRAPEV